MSRSLSVPRGGGGFLQRAVEDAYDAVTESALVEELQLGARVGRQCRIAPTEENGPDEQVKLVDQPGLESLCRQVRTSHDQIAAGRGLQVAHGARVEVSFEPGMGS